MKPLPFHVTKLQSESIKVETDILPHFYDSLHFHKDNQLTLIRKSFGTLYISDKIIPFSEGDVFFIGENIPHVFRNDDFFYSGNDRIAESISIYFENKFLGNEFFMKPEYNRIKDLITAGATSYKLKNQLKEGVKKALMQFPELSGLERIIQLLVILNKMSGSKDLQMLSDIGFAKRKASDNARISAVLDHLIGNFQTTISLKDAAAIANLSETSFCRYFKLHTRRTFSTYLNEIRIGHACKLLMEKELSVSQICYTCGFNNISNFNRQFKAMRLCTPREYALRHQLPGK